MSGFLNDRDHGCELCRWLEQEHHGLQVSHVFKRTGDSYMLVAAQHGPTSEEQRERMMVFFRSTVHGQGKLDCAVPGEPHFYIRWKR